MRRILFISLVLVACASLLVWRARPETFARSAAESPQVHRAAVDERTQRPLLAHADLAHADVARGGGAPVRPRIARKYRYLLADLARDGRDPLPILRLLDERDALVASIDVTEQAPPQRPSPPMEARLSVIEARLRELMGAAAYDSYQLLKDSDPEQYQLDEFSGGIGEVSRLSDAQQRALLETKLRHKRQFEQLAATSGLERAQLSLSERMHAFAVLEQGLRDYRTHYLAEIGGRLDDAQLTALRHFEDTEFRLELERLQRAINSR